MTRENITKMNKFLVLNDKRKSIFYIIFSFLFSLSMTMGYRVYGTNSLNLSSAKSVILWILLTVLLTVLIYFIIFAAGFLDDRFKGKIYKKFLSNKFSAFWVTPFKPINRWILLLIFALVLIIAWLPSFLSYYPMMNSYDLFYTSPYWFSQTGQARSGDYFNHHPVLHTFFWKLALDAGDKYNVSPFVLFSIGQMLVVSVLFAKVVVYMCMKKKSKTVCLLTLIFFAIPVNGIFVQIPVKDVSLAVVLLLFTLNLYRIFNHDEGVNYVSGIVMAIVEGLLCCMFRRNFIYAFVVFFILALFFGKGFRKYATIIFVGVTVSFALISGPLFKHIGVRPGEKREALSVPIQQLAYVINYAPEKLTDENIFEISAYMPYYDRYNPRFADPVKDVMNDELLEGNFINFIKLWGKVGLKCPGEYIDSFLTLNIPYWYMGADTIDPYAQRTFIERGNYEDHTPLISENVLRFLEKEGDFEGIDSWPIIRILFKLALPLWLLSFAAIKCFGEKKNATAMVMVLLLCFVLTFLLGPVSNMRYIYPIFTCYPIIVFLCISRKGNQSNENI